MVCAVERSGEQSGAMSGTRKQSGARSESSQNENGVVSEDHRNK